MQCIKVSTAVLFKDRVMNKLLKELLTRLEETYIPQEAAL